MEGNSATTVVVEDKQEQKTNLPTAAFAEPFDLEKLKFEINLIIEDYKEQHRSLELTVLKQPVLLDGETVTFELNGEIQEGFFHKIKPEILQILRRKLNNHSIHLEAVIKEDVSDSKRKLYTSSDKLNFLLEKSPALADLKRRFGLETDF